MQKVGLKNWLALIVVGLVGQFAWSIENMFLNLYLFEQMQDASLVKWMVGLSAAAATITTLLMGALSDKLGKRKIFVSAGYIAWGLSIGLFAFITKDNITALFPAANAVFLTGLFIVILDCIMTFFGSTANDAAFNAYATDISTPATSSKIESVLSVLPLISMLIIFGGFSFLATGESWKIFFLIFGILTLVVGVLSLFFFPSDIVAPKKDTPYFKNIFHGFKPRVIKENPLLYLTFLTYMVFGIAIQVFMPYFLIHIQEGLGFKDLEFSLVMGIVLILASVFTVLSGMFLINKNIKIAFIITFFVTLLGMGLMFFAKDIVFLTIAGTILMSGYMIGVTILGAKVRDYTPRGEVGLFQGIRMIFIVLIPMIVGPLLGELSYSHTALEYENEYLQLVKLPNEYIYLGAFVVLLLVVIPAYFLFRKEKESKAAIHE